MSFGSNPNSISSKFILYLSLFNKNFLTYRIPKYLSTKLNNFNFNKLRASSHPFQTHRWKTLWKRLKLFAHIYIYICKYMCKLKLAKRLDRMGWNVLRESGNINIFFLGKINFCFQNSIFKKFHGQRRALKLVIYCVIKVQLSTNFDCFFLNCPFSGQKNIPLGIYCGIWDF